MISAERLEPRTGSVAAHLQQMGVIGRSSSRPSTRSGVRIIGLEDLTRSEVVLVPRDEVRLECAVEEAPAAIAVARWDLEFGLQGVLCVSAQESQRRRGDGRMFRRGEEGRPCAVVGELT